MVSTALRIDSPPSNIFHHFSRQDQEHTARGESASTNESCPVETLILGLIRLGVLVISQDWQTLYINAQAQTLCHTMLEGRAAELPSAIQAACCQFLESAADFQFWVSDYRANSTSFDSGTINQLLIRIKVRWLYSPTLVTLPALSSPLLVTLEDCNELVRLEMQQERHQYGLTERETEIGTLLRLGWSYQAIADHVHISVNTVKSHVRHLYNKRRKPFNLGDFDS